MSRNDGQRLIYWDACVYLAWLKGEDCHGPDVTAGIKEAADDNWHGKLTIITSTISLTEVLSAAIAPDKERDFRNTFNSQRHIIRDVDQAISRWGCSKTIVPQTEIEAIAS